MSSDPSGSFIYGAETRADGADVVWPAINRKRWYGDNMDED